MEMAAPALCRAFTQNAWRRDLCSNCFRSKDEHKAAAAARQKTPSDAARLAATAAVKSILKGPSKAANGIGKKIRTGVSFHKEESQVIGYGGDDEIHSGDEENDLEDVEPPSEGDLEREKAEQQELERVTKANTDFNSVIANLQLESITKEKQTPAVIKSGASGIPVPGGRSTYTGPLRLGVKEGDGNKKTLLVSVRPFGSDGEEVSKPVVKTKILVTNGYGNNASSVGGAKETKENSAKPLVNGNLTNGHVSSSLSKDSSLKLSVSSSGGNQSKTATAKSADSVSEEVKTKESCNSVKASENGTTENLSGDENKVSPEQENVKVPPKTDDETSCKDQPQNLENSDPGLGSKAVAGPISMDRSSNPALNSSSLTFSKNGKEEKSKGNVELEKMQVNGLGLDHTSGSKESVESVLGDTGTLHTKNFPKSIPVVPPSTALPNVKPSPLEGTKSSSNDGGMVQQAPVPAERKMVHPKAETVEQSIASPCETSCASNNKDSLIKSQELQQEETRTETVSKIPVERSSLKESVARETLEGEPDPKVKVSDTVAKGKNSGSDIISSSQPPMIQPATRVPVPKTVAPKQDLQQAIKKSEGETSSGSDVKHSTVLPSQKPALLAKRPAPSILKMGVPTGWHSKNPSQKNSSMLHPGNDSNEDKGGEEKFVNGIIKTQTSTFATAGNEKPSKPVNTIAKLRANFVNNNLKIIAESAAKIVNGTRYGTKTAVADEIPISKSNVMNLSVRPISISSRTNKAFHADDYELKDERIKGLSNLDKVSNSFPSIRAKGSGPDIRELLRTPEKENERIEFLAQGNNFKNSVDPDLLNGSRPEPLGIETAEVSLRDINQSGDAKEIQTEFEAKRLGASDVRSDQFEEEKLVYGGVTEGDASSRLAVPSSESPEDDSSKGESPTKSENGLDKTPPGEKNRKKGIVRRILFKSGNEIYRKAGEMVRSVRRSNEHKDDAENARDPEVKDAKDLSLMGKQPVYSKGEEAGEEVGYSGSEVPLTGAYALEGATKSEMKEIGCDSNGTCEPKKENISQQIMFPEEAIKGESDVTTLTKITEAKSSFLAEGNEKVEKLLPVNVGSSQPPLMAPRPSFLHGKSLAAQPWSPARAMHNIPGARSERAASVSALMSPCALPAAGGQRGRLSSLPTLESEGTGSNLNPQGAQVALRKPGPIISGSKPAIPAKPSKILEASSARQTSNQTPTKPMGERRGSATLSTPGSVGRSAGKRQAPKPPALDSTQKGKCSSPDMGDILSEINFNRTNDASHQDDVSESKRENPIGQDEGALEENGVRCSQNQPSQPSSLANNGEMEEYSEDSSLVSRGTHFVKNQALNASKSSSRVARETERRQMLIQLQSSNNRGTAVQPDGSAEVPNSVLQATATAVSARQRSASLGRGVAVASSRPPLPGGSLGRAAGEGAALSIVDTQDTDSAANVEIGKQEESTFDAVMPSQTPSDILENSTIHNASPVRSRSEGSLAIRLPVTPGEDGKNALGATVVEVYVRESMLAKGEEAIYDSPSGLSSKKKKNNTVRGFLKFLRRGSVRDDVNFGGQESKEEVSADSEPKTRPVIVHPMELDGACVEVVKGGGVDVRKRLEEESALETTKGSEAAPGGNPTSTNQSSPRRPSNISIAPPRPPPVTHSPSSPSLSSSSCSSSGSTPVRPRPPPPPRGQAPVPPSPGGSGQKPARPPPPKPAHLMRLGLLDREVLGGEAKNAGDGIYANLGEVRATLAPSKPQRTASMREVLGASGKASGDAPTPRIIPRVMANGSSGSEATQAPSCAETKAESSYQAVKESVSVLAGRVPPLDAGSKSGKGSDTVEVASKGEKLSWNVGAKVSDPVSVGAVVGRVDGSTDSSSEDDNSTAPPLPLAPPPSLPPPLPLQPPPSPPSHATSSSSSSSIGNALILPEDSGYESVEFHGAHDGEVSGGRWWAESSIAASRASVVTTTADSLEESYEAVVGANHRALADVLAQVCQPNPEEFGATMTLRWSDFLVEGPKGGVLRAVGPISFHRAALKGRAASSGRDSWRRVTLGISASPMADLPQYFRGCVHHDGSSASVSRCLPSLRPMCTFQDEIPNRFFSSETGSASPEVSDLIEATVMVFNPLHFYSLKTYLKELITERKSAQSFPPLPEESNWCNRACLFLLVLLDTLCSLHCGDDSLCVIREEAKPSPPVVADSQLSDHLSCPLPRLLVLPNAPISSPSRTAHCFQSAVAEICEATGGDPGMESFAHALNCILGLFQGAALDDPSTLARSRAVLELWFFGPPIFHGGPLHSPGGDRVHDEVAIDARDATRWGVKNPLLSVGEPEPLSVEGELLSATPRRWLDLERAGALRSLAVSALHRGSRVPSPLESGLEVSNAEEATGVAGKCCRGWRVGEIGGRPTLPACEEVRLRFLVGTSGSEVADAWEMLARSELSSPLSAIAVGRTYVDAPLRKLTAWSISSGPEIGEAQC
ncbi:serine-rich adhesin for platelets isoform X2 [Ischnura elegans]|uniref:serine-rich adhesin for platelets isoform X2 n=1 Tax=Ischnura elegans TaxID=197161 RepID=UPI001ED89B64|nr:serine-rich adhesin for platelets isoform X2 [Ischnura elegans]